MLVRNIKSNDINQHTSKKSQHNQVIFSQKKTFSLTSILPNVTTLCALGTGLTSVRFALQNQWEWAVASIIFAAIFDIMDGRLARYLNVSSRFGAELDSLSDFISFGTGPALILYLRSLHNWGDMGWVIGLSYTMCMALRLARFNTLSIEGNDKKWSPAFFMGFPAPMAAYLVLLPTVLYIRFGWDWLLSPALNSVIVLSVSAGAVSRIPTFSTKKIYIPRKYVLSVILVIALFIAALFADLWLVIAVIGIGYVCTVPLSIAQFKKNQH